MKIEERKGDFKLAGAYHLKVWYPYVKKPEHALERSVNSFHDEL